MEIHDYEFFDGERLLGVHNQWWKKTSYPKKPHTTTNSNQQNLAWKNYENLVLILCECIWFDECAYSRCKITQASLGYIDEDVQHPYISLQNETQAKVT